MNLYALCSHMRHLQEIYREYRLYDVLGALKSPAGPSLYGHLTDDAPIARRTQPVLRVER